MLSGDLMKRKIEQKLLDWKLNRSSYPLILNGVRQVGKTYSLVEFGSKNYDNYAYFNFEDNRPLAELFDADFDIPRLIKSLGVLNNQTITENNTLIIFDEIQCCERALTSLKYFNEHSSNYHIVAAGSLLGVAIKRDLFSFPVGKVDFLNMYPLDFEEFLWANDQYDLAEMIRTYYDRMSEFPLHLKALDWYYKYITVGGMPNAVSTYIHQDNYIFVQNIQKNINLSYTADMARYVSAQEANKIMDAWDSIPAQLAKETNKKFQYAKIRSGARAYDYISPINWLKNSGIIYKCTRVTEWKTPLIAYADNDQFKIYMSDIGLLFVRYGISADSFLYDRNLSDITRGGLTENYVMQALKANEYEPYYWSMPSGGGELDFILQNDKGDLIPIECKSGRHVRANTLKKFMETVNPPYGIRISEKNFGYENNIKSIPLYAVFCIDINS